MNRTFEENLMNKLKNLSEVNRNNGTINHDLTARVNMNLSVEEVDYLAFCIQERLEKKYE